MLFQKRVEVTKLEACALSIIQWFFQEVTIKRENSTFKKNERISFTQINLKVDSNPNRSREEISSLYKYKRVRVNARFLLPKERIIDKRPKNEHDDRLTAEIVFMKEPESTDWQIFTVGIEFNFVYHHDELLKPYYIESFVRSFQGNSVDRIGRRGDFIDLTERLLSSKKIVTFDL